VVWKERESEIHSICKKHARRTRLAQFGWLLFGVHEFQEGLATLTFNRPPSNVLNIATMEEINSALKGFQGLTDLKLLPF
jgi:hypothetical protein